MSSHCLKWGPFPPNEIGRIAQHVREGEGRNQGKDILIWLVLIKLKQFSWGPSLFFVPGPLVT